MTISSKHTNEDNEWQFMAPQLLLYLKKRLTLKFDTNIQLWQKKHWLHLVHAVFANGCRSMTWAIQGRGPRVKPGMGSRDGIKSKSVIPFAGIENRNRCITEEKNKKLVLLASDWPRQILFPVEDRTQKPKGSARWKREKSVPNEPSPNVIKWSDLMTLSQLSRWRSGQKRNGSSQTVASVKTDHRLMKKNVPCMDQTVSWNS